MKKLKQISISLTEDQAFSLTRMLYLIEINLKVNPMKYGEDVKGLVVVAKQLDDKRHEANWCMNKNCEYYKNKEVLPTGNIPS